jgi:protease I
MAQQLQGKKVVALVTNGFEQVELFDPKRALEEAGATVHVVSLEKGRVRGWNRIDWGEEVNVDRSVQEVMVSEYDALLLPGGVMNPDHLRKDERAVALVRSFFNAHKPVAAICHAPWLLIEAGVVRGYRVTSYPSVRTDLKNAGAEWIDAEVVVDRGLVTSRRPADLPAFNEKMIEEFAEGRHVGGRADQPAASRA